MIKQDLSHEQLKQQQEKRRAYMRSYMKSQREKGIHKKLPKYIKASKDRLLVEFDCRKLQDLISKGTKIKLDLIKEHKKEINRLHKSIEKLQHTNSFNEDLIVRYQSTQDYFVQIIKEQEQDIDNLFLKIKSYEKQFN